MIKFENTEVVGWEAAIRGMRNPMNSWEKSDSKYCIQIDEEACVNHNEFEEIACNNCEYAKDCSNTILKPIDYCKGNQRFKKYIVGPNDLDLMKRLQKAGSDHRKFMRMITVYVDITAPLYWFKEFDTYKVGTVANSCSTMHKIADKEFTLDDFSHEHLTMESITFGLEPIIDILNKNRELYLQWKNAGEDKKNIWWQMIQLLPSSYNQKRTVQLNYEVLANIYKSRKNHKLDEWINLCKWIEELPYAKELIISE